LSEWDYIIVGAGSAGCVLANLLSADPRHRVLLLEAGGDDRKFWIRTPIGYGKVYFDASVNWKYHAEPDPGIAGRAAYFPRGKVLGGSSSINAMVYCRGLPSDFDDWRDAGNPGWGWADVEPIFDRFEHHVRPDGSKRGDGPLWVSDREPEYHGIKRFFYAAARELGLPVSTDLNGPAPEGVGAYPITTRHGRRCSAADAFLRPAMARPNLRVATNALAERILFEGRRATGVQYRDGSGSRRATASAEVILAAGAINSPQLLQLSGIGPGALLQRLGLPVLHANDGVGGHMQDHLGVNYYFRASEPTLNAVLGTWRGRIPAGIRYLLLRSGPLSLSVNQFGGIVRSSPGLHRPDAQLYFNPLSYSTEIAGQRELLKPDPYPGFIMGFNACRPTSLGRVDIAAPDPARAPKIKPNYLSTNQDLADVVACARLIGRLQATEAMRPLVIGMSHADLLHMSDEAIIADFRARSGTVFHPCGTCRMAPAEAGGVVDARLRVYGVERLRVVDASVFPNITSANTNAPTIMVAHKAARAILMA
jgi:choline dehydrogenase